MKRHRYIVGLVLGATAAMALVFVRARPKGPLPNIPSLAISGANPVYRWECAPYAVGFKSTPKDLPKTVSIHSAVATLNGVGDCATVSLVRTVPVDNVQKTAKFYFYSGGLNPVEVTAKALSGPAKAFTGSTTIHVMEAPYVPACLWKHSDYPGEQTCEQRCTATTTADNTKKLAINGSLNGRLYVGIPYVIGPRQHVGHSGCCPAGYTPMPWTADLPLVCQKNNQK